MRLKSYTQILKIDQIQIDKSILIEPQQGGGGVAGVDMRKIPIGVKRINVDKPNGGEILDTLNIMQERQTLLKLSVESKRIVFS